MQKMQETHIQSLGKEDPLEEEMTTHYSILAQKIPWMEEPGGLCSIDIQRVGHDWWGIYIYIYIHTHTHTYTSKNVSVCEHVCVY